MDMHRFWAELIKSDISIKKKRYDKDRERKKTEHNCLHQPESFDGSKALCNCTSHDTSHASYDPSHFTIMQLLKLKTNMIELINSQNCECGRCPHIHYESRFGNNNNNNNTMR